MTAVRLRDDIDSLNPLFDDAATWFSDVRRSAVDVLTIEKDFWVTELLRAVATPIAFEPPTEDHYPVTVRAVFKGGTSLSKAHRIIDRFSEDVDIYVQVTPTPGTIPESHRRSGSGEAPAFTLGNSRADSIFKSVAKRVGDAIGVTATPQAGATSGLKRAFAYHYPRPDDAAAWATGLKEGVQLELVRMGTPSPNSPHELRSMLSEWAAHTGQLVVDEWVELEPFVIDVLAPSRTLVDKLCILHDRGVQMQRGDLAAPGFSARHYYDVYRLLGNQSVLDSIDAEEGVVATYADHAAKASAEARRPPEAFPDGGFPDSPAFAPEVLSMAEADYNAEMARLGYGTYPTLAEVAERVAANMHRLRLNSSDEPAA